MPRKPTGDRALTPAERQAHQRAKHKAEWSATQQELARLREIVLRSPEMAREYRAWLREATDQLRAELPAAAKRGA